MQSRCLAVVIGFAAYGFLLTGVESSAQPAAKKKAAPVAQKVPAANQPVAAKQLPEVVLNQAQPKDGTEGETHNGQSGDQGAKQNGQAGDQGEKQNNQAGDQGDKQNGQTGDQSDKKGAFVPLPANPIVPVLNPAIQPKVGPVVNQPIAKKGVPVVAKKAAK